MLIFSPAVISVMSTDIIRFRELQSTESAAKIIRRAYANIDPDIAEILKEDKDAIIDIHVSFHDTWHKREFPSNYGMCAMVLVRVSHRKL
jgi:F420-0:gamma-glutamyl ligase